MTPADKARIAEDMARIDPYPGKSCGGCTACCSVVPVREVGTGPWQRCPHVRTPPAVAVGCSIYPNRPRSCRLWSCGWLAADWPDDMRPDRCGVIVDPAEDLIWLDDKEIVAARIWVMRGHEDDWRRDPVQALVLSIVHAGFAVLWDMPPGPDGVRLARVFRLNEAGGLEVHQPTPAGNSSIAKGMNEAERFWRARQLADKQKTAGETPGRK